MVKHKDDVRARVMYDCEPVAVIRRALPFCHPRDVHTAWWFIASCSDRATIVLAT